MGQAQELMIDLQPRDRLATLATYRMKYANDLQIYRLLPALQRLFPSITNGDRVDYGEQGTEKRMRRLAAANIYRRIGWPHRRSFERHLSTINYESRFSRGAKILCEELGETAKEVAVTLARNRQYFTRPSDDKSRNLRHHEEVNNFRVAATLALLHHPAAVWPNKLPDWLLSNARREISVTVPNEIIPPKVMNTVQKPGEFDTQFTRIPDDSFVLIPDKNETHRVLYFYERERTRKNSDRDAARIFTYWQWFETGVFKEEADDVRILFEMTTEEHMRNMMETVYKTIPDGSRLFWFTNQELINRTIKSKVILKSFENLLRGTLPGQNLRGFGPLIQQGIDKDYSATTFMDRIVELITSESLAQVDLLKAIGHYATLAEIEEQGSQRPESLLEKLTEEYDKLASTRFGLLDDPSIILESVWTVAHKKHEGQMHGLLDNIA